MLLLGSDLLGLTKSLNWRVCLDPDRWIKIAIHLKGRCPVDFWKSSLMILPNSTFAFGVVISIGVKVCSFGHFPKENVGCVICLFD